MWISKIELRLKQTNIDDKSEIKKVDSVESDEVANVYFQHDEKGRLINKLGSTVNFLSEAKKLVESFKTES